MPLPFIIGGLAVGAGVAPDMVPHPLLHISDTPGLPLDIP